MTSQTKVSSMQAIVLKEYGGTNGLEVAERTVPEPGSGQVLIQVKASPVNPSDLIFLGGHNPNPRKLPSTPGFEGAGIVIKSGGGTASDALVGKNVSFRSRPDGDGAWAEYAITDAERCIPLLANVAFEAGAMLQVNPLTAWTLVDSAQKAGHKFAVQNAAASALGRMVVKFAAKRKLGLINIVRKDEQAAILKELGAQHVLNSQAADFEDELKSLCREWNATVAFDAIAGGAANQLLRAMPRHSELWSYGGLSEQPLQIEPMILIYEQKAVRGFWGPPAFYNLSKSEFEAGVLEIQQNLSTIFKTEISARFSINEFDKALRQYKENMTQGKILFVFN